ncbi:MAG: ankyrin repeat domain-containing protein [Phycisphaeraceae bacterium]
MPRLLAAIALLTAGLIGVSLTDDVFAARPDAPRQAKKDEKKDEKKKKVSAKDWREAVDPLHAAAFDNELATAQKLIKGGADVNSKVTFRLFTGYTPLHMAAYEGHDKMVAMLVAAKADLEVKDKTAKRTPLHLACAYNRIAAAKALIKAGADINAKDGSDNTPLRLTSDKAIQAELKKAGAKEK